MRILLMGDIHIGSIKDTKYVYQVMTNIIDKELISQKCDAVVILGDYFHRLFKVNEEYVSCAINIMSYLIRACSRTHTKIRIIYGTESHEMGQYKLFNYHFTSAETDIRVIDTATEEELFPNQWVLYLPEEYVFSKKKFYKRFLDGNKRYTYCFGHGIIRDGMPSNIVFNEPDKKEKHVPIFVSGELAAIANITIFGHYHVHTNINDTVFYIGSLFRDSFGEEDPKGYGIIDDNGFHFIENDEAYVYKTYTYEFSHNIYSSTDTLLSEIKRIKDENEDLFNGKRIGKIRLVFHAPDNLDPSFRESLKDILMNESCFITLIKENKDQIMNEVKDEIKDKWEYLLDSSLAIVDKLHRYLVEEKGSEITLEELKHYIDGYNM